MTSSVSNCFRYLQVLCLVVATGICAGDPLYWSSEKESPIPLPQNSEAYQTVVNDIIKQSLHGTGKHQSYDRLADFTDKFGNRIAGSDNLENSIDYLIEKMKAEGLQNVHGEEVEIIPWVRNTESLYMTSPKAQPLAILGLGSSIPTPTQGIAAQVIVVKSFDELKSKTTEAAGKIVVFNQDFVSYGETVKYRVQGASKAAEVGAVAALIRTVAPLSIYSPHTGMQTYSSAKKIPAASITIEDAEMMQRMQERGETILVNLTMNCESRSPRNSRNIIAEIVGHTHPEEVVLFGGHIDSWDVGKGAMDDGGGAFISWQVLSLIRQLGLQPKRTLRMIMWTGEEFGGVGGQAYYKAHQQELKNFKFVMESDMGTFKPTGISFYGDENTAAIVRNVSQLLQPINASLFQEVQSAGGIGEDVTNWLQAGVPGASLLNMNQHYFYYHHSQGDTMTVQNPEEMDLCAAVWASLAYVMADVDGSYLQR